MKLVLIASLLLANVSIASTKANKVVYGDDNRVDVINSTNSMYVELSKSTAGMISNYAISVLGNGEVKLRGMSLENRGMCKSERFSQQPTVANCSGFLVGENLLATAGHCIRSASDCSSNSWVFDYKIDHNGQTEVTVPESSVYKCKRVVPEMSKLVML